MASLRTKKCFWGSIDKYIKVDDDNNIVKTNVADPQFFNALWIPVSEDDKTTYDRRSGSCFDWPETTGGGGKNNGMRRLLKTGPRGGKYYIKRGKKVYVAS